jgi:hypothetical protein
MNSNTSQPMPLPSGLPEIVANEEPISRFLTSRNHYNTTVVKPSAFIPNPKDGCLSVARHNAEPIEESERMAREDFNLPKASGVAQLAALAFRKEGLDFRADDTPQRHADVIGWPWREDDPEYGKSERKMIAAALAQQAQRFAE